MVDELLEDCLWSSVFRARKKVFLLAWQRPDFKQSSTKIRTHGYMLYKAQVTCCTLFPNTRGELLTCHVLKMKREFADYKNVEQ